MDKCDEDDPPHAITNREPLLVVGLLRCTSEARNADTIDHSCEGVSPVTAATTAVMNNLITSRRVAIEQREQLFL